MRVFSLKKLKKLSGGLNIMTQILINFLQPLDALPTATLQTSARVFDFEISEDAQKFYNHAMLEILLGLGAKVVDPSGNPQTPTIETINAGNIVFATPPDPTNALQISNAINLLNNWSKFKLVNSDGFQTYSSGNFGTTTDIEGTVVLTDPITGALLSNPPMVLTPSSDLGSGVTSLTTTMDQYMAQGLDKLIRSLRAAGWDPIADPTGGTAAAALAQITAPATSSIYGIASVVQKAIAASALAHVIGSAALTDSMSIQQVLMVDYVSRGNEILFAEMQKLKDAIDLNQSALSYLNSLQDLMNQKDPQKFIMQLQLLNGVNVNPQNPQGVFDTFEKQTYDQSLGTLTRIGNETPAGLQAYFNNLATGATIPTDAQLATGAFDDLSTATTVIAGYSAAQIIANLNYLTTQIGGQAANAASSGGLIQALNKIKSDFTSLQSSDPANVFKNWIQDTQAGDAGAFQRNLSNGIVSSQSFNDTQREKLREVMFVFEEFYKSATGLLSRLTQLLEKMADGIAR